MAQKTNWIIIIFFLYFWLFYWLYVGLAVLVVAFLVIFVAFVVVVIVVIFIVIVIIITITDVATYRFNRRIGVLKKHWKTITNCKKKNVVVFVGTTNKS